MGRTEGRPKAVIPTSPVLGYRSPKDERKRRRLRYGVAQTLAAAAGFLTCLTAVAITILAVGWTGMPEDRLSSLVLAMLGVLLAAVAGHRFSRTRWQPFADGLLGGAAVTLAVALLGLILF